MTNEKGKPCNPATVPAAVNPRFCLRKSNADTTMSLNVMVWEGGVKWDESEDLPYEMIYACGNSGSSQMVSARA